MTIAVAELRKTLDGRFCLLSGRFVSARLNDSRGSVVVVRILAPSCLSPRPTRRQSASNQMRLSKTDPLRTGAFCPVRK